METSDEEDADGNEGEQPSGALTKAGTARPNASNKALLKGWLKKLEDSAVLQHKADLKDLVKLGELKSNKFDTDFLLKCVEVQHQ